MCMFLLLVQETWYFTVFWDYIRLHGVCNIGVQCTWYILTMSIKTEKHNEAAAESRWYKHSLFEVFSISKIFPCPVFILLILTKKLSRWAQLKHPNCSVFRIDNKENGLVCDDCLSVFNNKKVL